MKFEIKEIIMVWDEVGQEKCLSWAFGDDWGSLPMGNLSARWNSRHGDLFVMNITDRVDESKAKIIKAFKAFKDNKE